MTESNPLPRPAVFLDRDGVLNVYLPGAYVRSPEELTLLPGVGAAIARLNAANFPVFIISNQQGVARGLMTQDDLARVDAALQNGVRAQGGQIERSYYCPHSASVGCECRKPRAGMLLQAAAEYHLDLSASFFVGDTEGDSQAARTAGVGKFVFVLSGKYSDASVADDRNLFPIPPDFIAPDLNAAVDWVLGHG